MKLKLARVQNYRSVLDSGWFGVESEKSILVGPNEAGKTVLLKALEQINPPEAVPKFESLRDFPRSQLSDLKLDESSGGTITPDKVTVVEAHFGLDEDDLEEATRIDENFAGCTYVFGRRLDNSYWHRIDGGPEVPTFVDIRKDLLRLASHVDERVSLNTEVVPAATRRDELEAFVAEWSDATIISGERASSLMGWLDKVLPLIEEENTTEQERFDRLEDAAKVNGKREDACKLLRGRLPIFVYFSSYFRVRPRLHLGLLADRLRNKVIDDDQYDRGKRVPSQAPWL